MILVVFFLLSLSNSLVFRRLAPSLGVGCPQIKKKAPGGATGTFPPDAALTQLRGWQAPAFFWA
jgi:hypothetical protein